MRKIKLLLAVIAAQFPTKLPDSPKRLEDWLGEVLLIAGMPDNPSFRHALATQIMHIEQRTVYKPKQYFITSLRAALIREQTFNYIEMLKNEQKAARDAAGETKTPRTTLV